MERSLGKSSISFIQYVIIFYYTISPFVYFLRLLEGYAVADILLRTMEPMLIIIVGMALVLKCFPPLDFYTLIIGLLGAYALIVGLVMGNEVRYVLAGFSHVLAGLLLYWYFRNISLDSLSFERFIKKIICFSTIAYIIALFIIYAGLDIYLGLDSSILLLGVFWSIYKKKPVTALFLLAMIFMSGKRGVLVAAFFGIVMQLFFTRLRNKFIIIGSILLIVTCLGVLGAMVFDLSEARIIQKFAVNNEQTINSFSAGRLEELVSAWDHWVGNYVKIIAGHGFGFAYPYVYMDTNTYMVDENYHNIHFSPANILIIWGLPLSLVVFALVIGLVVKISRVRNQEYQFAKITVYAFILYSLFVFNIFNEPILWVLIGILSKTANSPQSKQSEI